MKVSIPATIVLCAVLAHIIDGKYYSRAPRQSSYLSKDKSARATSRLDYRNPGFHFEVPDSVSSPSSTTEDEGVQTFSRKPNSMKQEHTRMYSRDLESSSESHFSQSPSPSSLGRNSGRRNGHFLQNSPGPDKSIRQNRGSKPKLSKKDSSQSTIGSTYSGHFTAHRENVPKTIDYRLQGFSHRNQASESSEEPTESFDDKSEDESNVESDDELSTRSGDKSSIESSDESKVESNESTDESNSDSSSKSVSEYKVESDSESYTRSSNEDSNES